MPLHNFQSLLRRTNNFTCIACLRCPWQHPTCFFFFWLVCFCCCYLWRSHFQSQSHELSGPELPQQRVFPFYIPLRLALLLPEHESSSSVAATFCLLLLNKQILRFPDFLSFPLIFVVLYLTTRLARVFVFVLCVFFPFCNCCCARCAISVKPEAFMP